MEKVIDALSDKKVINRIGQRTTDQKRGSSSDLLAAVLAAVKEYEKEAGVNL
jgi:hypothetical protein